MGYVKEIAFVGSMVRNGKGPLEIHARGNIELLIGLEREIQGSLLFYVLQNFMEILLVSTCNCTPNCIKAKRG